MLSQLAILATALLITFLAYSSQYLFLHIEPAPLSKFELSKFNILIACIWICYYRTCTVDPGSIPKSWKPFRNESEDGRVDSIPIRQRWCRKCEAVKPPRAHHCRTCRRCIPKMDHHCPWTGQCVSHFTFPHFIRFLFYAVVSMAYLEHFLYIRAYVVWENRKMPSYLGPSIWQLIHLFLLVIANSLTLFTLSILLARTLWSLGGNVTAIEAWEIERHKTLLRRARHLGGVLDGPDGIKVRIEKQEFPYDIGIWKNIQAGMGGSANVLSWFWPFSASPDRNTGLEFESNEFEDGNLSWPPPDPDRIPRIPRSIIYREDGAFSVEHFDQADEEISAFRHRQQEDMQRWSHNTSYSNNYNYYGNTGPSPGLVNRRRNFHDQHPQGRSNDGLTAEVESSGASSSASDSDFDGNYHHLHRDHHGKEHQEEEDEQEGEEGEGEEAWKNAEGERLRDFGVDEDVEFYDEDNIPLARLIEMRKLKKDWNLGWQK